MGWGFLHVPVASPSLPPPHTQWYTQILVFVTWLGLVTPVILLILIPTSSTFGICFNGVLAPCLKKICTLFNFMSLTVSSLSFFPMGGSSHGGNFTCSFPLVAAFTVWMKTEKNALFSLSKYNFSPKAEHVPMLKTLAVLIPVRCMAIPVSDQCYWTVNVLETWPEMTWEASSICFHVNSSKFRLLQCQGRLIQFQEFARQMPKYYYLN